MKKSLLLSFLIPVAFLPMGCETTDDASHAGHAHGGEAQHKSAWASVTEAVAAMNPTAGNKAKGTVRFTQVGEKVKVVADIEGLTPNQKHAIHVHESGDVSSPDGSAAGGHYNPENHEHGLADKQMRHAGDLGNLEADGQGKAHYEIMVDNISVAGLKNPVVGRAVIIHAKVDDGGQPTGNAGGRISQGAIGIVKPKP